MPERQARRIFGVLENRILRIAALIGAIALIIATAAATVRWFRDFSEGQHKVQSPQAKEATVLARLTAGVSSERFERDLMANADVSRPLPGGYVQHLYVRPYEYVQTTADQGGTVVSLLVLVTDRKFRPRLSASDVEFAMNATTIDQGIKKWGGPNLAAGYCAVHKSGYFERAGGYSATNDRYLVLGVTDIGTYNPRSRSEGIDVGPICKSKAVSECDASSSGDQSAPIPFAQDFLDCFTKRPDGQRLRAQLRPNLVVVTAPGTDYVPQLVDIGEAGIAAAGKPSSR